MTRCLMLDVDGVVVTGRPKDGAHWMTGLSDDLGIDKELLKTHFFQAHWQEIVTGRKDLTEVLQGCMPLIQPAVTPEQFINYWFQNDARLDERVLAQVGTLRQRGVTVFLATNQEHVRARYLMEDLGLAGHVDGIVYSAKVGAKKPDPAFYAACEVRSGRQGSDLILIDDTAQNVTAARQAGWRAEHWTGAEDLTELVLRS